MQDAIIVNVNKKYAYCVMNNLLMQDGAHVANKNLISFNTSVFSLNHPFTET